MNDLLRDMAPIPKETWEEIEAEATQTLKLTLAGRKLVDFSGPHGIATGAVCTGRLTKLDESVRAGVEGSQVMVQPLVCLRTPFTLARAELEAHARGAEDADFEPVVQAARNAALAEDKAIFHGYPAAGIEGIIPASKDRTRTITTDFLEYPKRVAEAVDALRIAGVSGPYAIALGPRCHTGLTTTFGPGGRPVIELVKSILDGPVVWAPAVDGAVVMALRGGDFQLTVGRDFSIGYWNHDATSVHLYLEETFTFRSLAPEAAVPLRYGS